MRFEKEPNKNTLLEKEIENILRDGSPFWLSRLGEEFLQLPMEEKLEIFKRVLERLKDIRNEE